MKDKAAFRSERSKSVMGNLVEGTESKEWQAVNVEEGTYVPTSRMFAIQSGTEADMAATKNTLEKSMRMGHPSMWWDPMGERFLFFDLQKKQNNPHAQLVNFSRKILQTPRPPRWNRATVAPRELVRPRQARHLTRSEAVASSQDTHQRAPRQQNVQRNRQRQVPKRNGRQTTAAWLRSTCEN